MIKWIQTSKVALPAEDPNEPARTSDEFWMEAFAYNDLEPLDHVPLYSPLYGGV